MKESLCCEIARSLLRENAPGKAWVQRAFREGVLKQAIWNQQFTTQERRFNPEVECRRLDFGRGARVGLRSVCDYRVAP